VESTLGPVAVKDDGVERDADDLDDDFNNDADKGPVLAKRLALRRER